MRLSLQVSTILLAALVSVGAGFLTPAGAQTPFRAPDPAPTTGVDLVELPNFEPTRDEARLEAYVDGIVEAHRRANKTPGVSVSVVRNGRVLFSKGYGLANAKDGTPVRGDTTLFRIGSVSKTFIWTAVMMLVEQDQIDLDADVNEYLKDVTIPEAFDAPVTMNDLMAHRAGFEDTLAVFTVNDDDPRTRSALLSAHMPARVYAPGARTSYSNWGAALAAQIVEDVSGVPYDAFLEREILAPLAMLDTTLAGPSSMTGGLRARLSKGYALEAGVWSETELMEIGPYAPAGAMSATANDMAQWMLLHLGGGAHNGAQIIAPETHAEMFSRAFDDRLAGGDVAHGFQAGVYKGVELRGHGGATAAFYTNMTLVPELGLGVYVSQNSTSDRTLVTDLAMLIVDHLQADQMPRLVGTTASDIDVTDYVGSYENNRRSFTRFERLFGATSVVAVSPADGGLTVSDAATAIHYFPLADTADVFESRNGARIVFGRDSAGQVTHFSGATGIHSYERVGTFGNPVLLNLAFGAAFFFSLTTLLGAWRRQGRTVTHKKLGSWLGRGSFIASLLVFVFFAFMVTALVQMSSAGPAQLLSYPPFSVTLFRFAGLLVFGASIAMVASLAPAWVGSGWSVWRKAHHSLFALAVAFLAVMLVFWRVIFSATV